MVSNLRPLEPTPAPVVLLVEDDLDTRELYEMAFQLENFRVASCPTAFAALRLAADLSPDAIVTDVGLRGTYDGVHFARQLRESRRTAEIPVIAVTGRQAEDLAREGVFIEVLQKPVLPDVLIARVRSVLGRSSALRARGDARRCPTCDATLTWSERRQILGQTFDYYGPCAGGCGMFYFDNGQHVFVRLVP